MSSNKRYPAAQMFNHWLVFILVSLAFISVFLHDLSPRILMPIHFYCGFFVLVFTVLRILYLVIFGRKRPEITPPLAPKVKLAATLVKIALVVIFIVIPLTGMVMMTYFGRDFQIFGYTIMQGIVSDEATRPELIRTGKDIKEIHEALGFTALGLIGLHAVAALWHHYIVKDNTLKRMMPAKCSKEQ